MLALAPDFDALVRAAEGGDARAWGRLYGMAGAFLTGPSHALPAELADVLAPRLMSLSRVLMTPPKGDVRRAIYDATAPVPKIRVVGAKRHGPSPLELAAEAALEMLAVDCRPGREREVIERCAQMVGRKASSVRTQLRTLRRQRGITR